VVFDTGAAPSAGERPGEPSGNAAEVLLAPDACAMGNTEGNTLTVFDGPDETATGLARYTAAAPRDKRTSIASPAAARNALRRPVFAPSGGPLE
jgi:hypothetical protein